MNTHLLRHCLSLLCLALTLTAHAAQPLPAVPRFAKFEAAWTFPDQSGNPFDPAQNDVQVSFRGPDGASVRVPAFWDGDRWRVRFAPPRVGRYTLSVSRNGRAVHPGDLTAAAFQCVPSSNPGYVRRDPARAQRFVFDNGRGYYPLGINQAWHSTGLPEYPEMFTRMHGAGMNWARVWMTFWDGKALEWSPARGQSPPIGRFSLDAARRLDTVLDSATREGVYVQLCLQHHGQYTAHTDPNWRDNPYNAANGGFLQNPEDFFTDARARQLTRAKYRYVVARWGYATHLLSWELFNEVQNITEARPHFGTVLAWHKEMAAFLRAEDVNHHLVTSSYSNPLAPAESPERALAEIGLDYDQIHAYVPDIVSYLANLDVSGLKTPVFLGEWGPSGADQNPSLLTGRFLHDGLWASLMDTTAGAAQFWYWDAVARNNSWPQFASATAFARRADLAQPATWRKLAPSVTGVTGRADMSFAPPRGFEANTTSDVTVSPNGQTEGLGGIASFVQGQGHREMTPRPIAFHLTCAAPCRFRLAIGTVARAGAHPELRLDGKMAGQKDYPGADRDQNADDTLTLDVPAGAHVVSVWNTGPDWFTVRRITITNYAPAVAVLARGTGREAVFWAYSRDRGGVNAVSGSVSLPMAAGTYSVQLWDSAAGRPLGSACTVSATGGRVTVHLPPFRQDIAGMVTARGR